MSENKQQKLKEYVEKLFEIEKEENKYKNLVSDIKKEKEILNQHIMDYMISNDIKDKDIIYGDKKLKYTSMNIQDTITKKLINDRLKIFLKDDIMAANATNFIYSERNKTTKNYLKISDIKNKL